MAAYLVKHPIKSENGVVAPGGTITLSEKDGQELMAQGIVERTTRPAPDTPPEDKNAASKK